MSLVRFGSPQSVLGRTEEHGHRRRPAETGELEVTGGTFRGTFFSRSQLATVPDLIPQVSSRMVSNNGKNQNEVLRLFNNYEA